MDRMKKRRDRTSRKTLQALSVCMALIMNGKAMEQMTTNAILNESSVASRMCSRPNSGAAVITEKAYPTSGEFEFKI